MGSPVQGDRDGRHLVTQDDPGRRVDQLSKDPSGADPRRDAARIGESEPRGTDDDGVVAEGHLHVDGVRGRPRCDGVGHGVNGVGGLGVGSDRRRTGAAPGHEREFSRTGGGEWGT